MMTLHASKSYVVLQQTTRSRCCCLCIEMSDQNLTCSSVDCSAIQQITIARAASRNYDLRVEFHLSSFQQQKCEFDTPMISKRFSIRRKSFSIVYVEWSHITVSCSFGQNSWQLTKGPILYLDFRPKTTSQDISPMFCFRTQFIYLKQNIAEMFQDVVLGQKARYKTPP